MRRPLVLLSTVLLAVALYVANTAWWLDAEVLDTDEFVNSAVVVLNQPSSRDTMATIVVARLVEEIPLLTLVEDALVGVFSDLLGTDQLQDVLVLISQELHQRMVSGDTGPIVIDLEPYHDVLLSPIEAISPELAGLVPDSWFRSVEVLEGGVIPDLSPYAENGLRTAYAAVAIAFALVVIIIARTDRWMIRLVSVGGAFLVAGGLSVLAVPAGRATVSSIHGGTSREALVLSLYDELTRSLTAQSLALTFVGLAMIGVAIVIWANRTPTAGA
jgi:hypothetical protein